MVQSVDKSGIGAGRENWQFGGDHLINGSLVLRGSWR